MTPSMWHRDKYTFGVVKAAQARGIEVLVGATAALCAFIWARTLPRGWGRCGGPSRWHWKTEGASRGTHVATRGVGIRCAESLTAFIRRAGGAWSTEETPIANGVVVNRPLELGWAAKVAVGAPDRLRE
jgi:hypothetical protein